MNRIKFRRGSLNNKKNIDIEDGEPIYLTDTKRLYVSNEDVAINNVYVGTQEPNDPGINVWIDPQGVNNVIDMIYPIGSIYISATNTDPSSIFGGTWELIDKEFIPTTSELNGFSSNSNVSINAVRFARNGHSIDLEFTFTPAVDITDSTLVLGNLEFSVLGVSRLNQTMRPIGSSDGSNVAILFYIHPLSGEVQILDIFGENSASAGNSCYFFTSMSVNYNYMLDSACDKFYWKRTA